MKAKTLKRISLISIVLIVALVTSLVVMTFLVNQPMAQAAAGTLYTSEYQGDNGTLPGGMHYTWQGIAEKYGVSTAEVFTITSGEELYMYLNGEYNRKVGFLACDVALSYNSERDGYDNIHNTNSSAAIFDKIFDGNGYTVKIYGGVGLANSTAEIRDNESYRSTYRNGASRYDNVDVWYEYAGFLVAQNYGTIANFTIDYASPHNVIEAVWGETGNKTGDLGMSTADRLMSSREGVFSAGIIAGLNGYGGVIDNVKINVRNAFTVIKRAGKSGYFLENAGYAGAIAGRIEDNSKISNCWVDLATGGVFAGAQGKSTANPLTDNHNSLAIAGGLVGNIDSGTAQLTYCALTGSGQVKAFANRAAKNEKFKSYSGGVAGACIRIATDSSITDCNSDTNMHVQLGQIKGIISSWIGSRFSNFGNSPQESMGSLFDAVGSDDEIESLAILFNLETLMDNNASGTHAIKPTDSDGKLVLDSSGNLRNWLEIHPSSDGGSMTVMFDNDNPNYDIRIHIVADGHDEFKNSGAMEAVDMSGARYYQYKMREGEGGGFIWSGIFESANDSSNHISLILDDPIYAEIYLISSKNSGKYNYEFGRMGILEYSDTNGNNGVKPYAGTADPLKLPTVTMTNYPAFDTSVFTNENLWNISRSGKNVALSQTYMPGTYNMKVETILGERVYGYYNEAEKMLAWQPKTDYLFTILQGVLNYGSGTTTTDGWQDSVTFELTMNSASDFDSIEFQRNGEFPSDSAQGFTRPGSGASAFYTVNETTGKNGTAYTFYAYKRDTVTEENVVVAVSESRTVRIDKEAPEISEVKYYMVENGTERLLTDDDMEYIQEHWTKNQILAKFSVSENGKSGIASAAPGSNIDYTIFSDNDRDVVVTINDSNPMDLEYVDMRGNSSTLHLQVNVDRVEGKLTFVSDTYEVKEDSRFKYWTESVLVFYRATFGLSDWRLYYSYQKDAQGEDIWIAGDLMTDREADIHTFTIDWNMGVINSTGDGGADFKIKIVNEVGLYDEVYPTDVRNNRLPNDVIGNYTIWLRVANIYLDTNLNNIFVNDGGKVLSVEEILKSEEDRAKYFDKQYDGTDEYAGKKNYQFYTDLSILNTNGFYSNEKLGVIYTPAARSRPRIDIGSNGIVPVELRYMSSSAGNAKLAFQVVLTGVDGYNYIVYFTDLSGINFEEDVEVEEGTYWEYFEIDVKITKRQVYIELDEQEAFSSNKIYYYGDEVPTAIDVYVEATGEYVSVAIDTKASSTATIDEYEVKGISPAGYDNIDYIINSTTIVINPRPVAVDLRFDGGSIGNIPTGIQAGKTHAITGTYQDVNGVTQNANIEYVLNNKPVSTLAEVGEYIINISLPNNNYTIEGQKSFRFNIAKGQLEIETGVRIKDYTEEQVEYDLIIDKEAKEQGLYSDSDLKVTYYEYLEGAVYNAIDKKIEGKASDIPMTACPTERGLYLVKVEFVTKDNPNFFPKSDYAEGYLIIERAKTSVNVENIVLEYSYYNAEKFTFDLVAAVAEVRSSSNKQLWSASMLADGIVKVQYKDTSGSYVDVAPSPNDGGGWYSDTGRYEYRIIYLGNDDYQTSSIDVVMVINEAELVGITFNSVEAVYDGANHVPTVNGLLDYTGLKITFRSGVTQIHTDGLNANEAIKGLDFVDAKEYTVTMSISKEGFATKEWQAKVTIHKAKMEVTASIVDVVYDGKRHEVTFSGLDYNEDGTLSYKGEAVIISSGNSEGNSYATNVYIEPGVGPSYYSGEVTLRAANYEDLTLKTHITIRQALLPYTEISRTLPNKVPSGVSLSEYRGYFVDSSGASIECALQYRKYLKGNEDQGEIVTPDENGVLADGKYTVWIVIPNDNYYIDRYWTVDIGEINSAEISVGGWVAIGAVAVLMVAAVITAVVVVKKRKKAGIV